MQGKVLTEPHQEKVKCAYTHGRMHPDMSPPSPAHITRACPPTSTLFTLRLLHTCCTHTHTHSLFISPRTTLHTSPKNSVSPKDEVLLFFTYNLHLQSCTAVLTCICDISDNHHTTTSTPPSMFHHSYEYTAKPFIYSTANTDHCTNAC